MDKDCYIITINKTNGKQLLHNDAKLVCIKIRVDKLLLKTNIDPDEPVTVKKFKKLGADYEVMIEKPDIVKHTLEKSLRYIIYILIIILLILNTI